MMADPDETVANFLVKLPMTIRSDILVFVLAYCFEFRPSSAEELTEVLHRELTSFSGMRRFGAVLRVIAATEHILERAVVTALDNKADPTASVGLATISERLARHVETMTLGGELKLRHLEGALRVWSSLRAGALSPGPLRGFEDRCLNPQIVRSGTSP
jgi:hypothetical protein